MSNANFGKFNPAAVTFDDSACCDNRDFLWDINVDLQHEIIARPVGGRRLQPQLGRQLHRHREHARSARPTSTSSASPCRTTRGWPNAGQQRCGFYDVKPALFGQGTLRVTNAKEFVGQNGNTQLPQRYWDGFWISADGRLPDNIKVGGGIDIGTQVDDHCFTVDVPNQPLRHHRAPAARRPGTASTPPARARATL